MTRRQAGVLTKVSTRREELSTPAPEATCARPSRWSPHAEPQGPLFAPARAGDARSRTHTCRDDLDARTAWPPRAVDFLHRPGAQGPRAATRFPFTGQGRCRTGRPGAAGAGASAEPLKPARDQPFPSQRSNARIVGGACATSTVATEVLQEWGGPSGPPAGRKPRPTLLSYTCGRGDVRGASARLQRCHARPPRIATCRSPAPSRGRRRSRHRPPTGS